MTFIVQKAFPAQIVRMRGFVFTLLTFGVVSFAPEAAFAREAEQAETADCPTKLQRRIIRPLTESTPLRKKDKDRVRRILM